jgi:hypothetical protein
MYMFQPLLCSSSEMRYTKDELHELKKTNAHMYNIKVYYAGNKRIS